MPVMRRRVGHVSRELARDDSPGSDVLPILVHKATRMMAHRVPRANGPPSASTLPLRERVSPLVSALVQWIVVIRGPTAGPHARRETRLLRCGSGTPESPRDAVPLIQEIRQVSRSRSGFRCAGPGSGNRCS